MITIGKWLDRADEEGLKSDPNYNSFRAMYLEDGEYKNWLEVVEAYELHGVKVLTYNNIRHIVVLEIADGSINQVLSLENEDESFRIFSDGRCGGIFNTDGTAFIQYLKDDKEQAVFMIDNSPADLTDNEDDWFNLTGGRDDVDLSFNREVALHEFRQELISNRVDINLHRVTSANTIFVTQL